MCGQVIFVGSLHSSNVMPETENEILVNSKQIQVFEV